MLYLTPYIRGICFCELIKTTKFINRNKIINISYKEELPNE